MHECAELSIAALTAGTDRPGRKRQVLLSDDMRATLVLLVLCAVSSAVKHSFKFFFSTSSGITNFPEFSGSLIVDDVRGSYCDSNKNVKPKQDAWKKVLEVDPRIRELYTKDCMEGLPSFFKARLKVLMEHFNQTQGVHSLQVVQGCEWDEDTEDVSVGLRMAYDGEDLLSLDPHTFSWIALRPEAAALKQRWDAEKPLIRVTVDFFTLSYPEWLKKYLNYSSAPRPAPPSVSLLQTSPSSPVSCYATGFYPGRAEMFWRKDGEQIHGGVDQGEILPNHDGTFQMRVDLDLSSVRAEDWRRYDCVFQLSGVKDDVITKLDKAVIRTNLVPQFPAGAVVGLVVGLMLLISSVGVFVWKKKKKGSCGGVKDDVEESAPSPQQDS